MPIVGESRTDTMNESNDTNMNDETTTAYAYYPIDDTDVEIECRPRHRRTTYDQIDGEELPVLIDQAFRHDPVEGCQGTYTEIIEIEGGCPNCGYGRAQRSVHTLAGEHNEKCNACGVDITDRGRDDWTARKPFDAISALRKDAELLGKAGDTRLYKRRSIPDNVVLVRHGSTVTMQIPDLLHAAQVAIRAGYDEDEKPLPPARSHPLLAAMADTTDTSDGGDDDAE